MLAVQATKVNVTLFLNSNSIIFHEYSRYRTKLLVERKVQESRKYTSLIFFLGPLAFTRLLDGQCFKFVYRHEGIHLL